MFDVSPSLIFVLIGVLVAAALDAQPFRAAAQERHSVTWERRVAKGRCRVKQRQQREAAFRLSQALEHYHRHVRHTTWSR